MTGSRSADRKLLISFGANMWTFVALASLALLLAIMTAPCASERAFAAENDIASGTWGTCPWEINAEGVLTVHPGIGADPGEVIYGGPWDEYSRDVKRVVFQQEEGNKVVLPATCQRLLSFSWQDEKTGAWVSNLESVDLSGVDSSQVKSMAAFFGGCSKLVTVDISPLNTSAVENMEKMFWGCSALTDLNLGTIRTSNVTEMSGMFYGCSSLESLDLSSFDTTSLDDSLMNPAYELMSDCWSLTSFQTGDGWTIDYARFPMDMYDEGGVLHAAGSAISTGAHTYTRDASQNRAGGVWGTCDWSVDAQGALVIGEGIGDDSDFPWSAVLEGISSLRFSGQVVAPPDCGGLFSGCASLVDVDFSGFDTSNVTSMSRMFAQCNSLSNLSLAGFDTSTVTNMEAMFYGCSSLAYLDLSTINATSASMRDMFEGCSALSRIVLGESFTFKGSSSSVSCELPSPPGEGKWMLNSRNQAFTPSELAEAYDGSAMSGMWVWSQTSWNGLRLGFTNTAESFGYKAGLTLANDASWKDAFERIFTKTQAKVFLKQAGRWTTGQLDGSCYGMAASSAMLGYGSNVKVRDFDTQAQLPSDLLVSSTGALGYSFKSFVETMQASLYDPGVQSALDERKTAGELYEAVKTSIAQGKPVIVGMWNNAQGQGRGHAVLAYACSSQHDIDPSAPEYEGSISVYDPNLERTESITLNGAGDESGWSYSAYGIPGGSDCRIGFVTYDDFVLPWTRSAAAPTMSMLAVESGAFEVRTDNNLVANLTANGTWNAYQGSYWYRNLRSSADESPTAAGHLGTASIATQDDADEDATLLYVPTGKSYQIKAAKDSELDVTLSDAQRSVSVIAPAGAKATLSASDTADKGAVNVQVATGKTFEVSVAFEQADGTLKEATVSGEGNGSYVTVEESSGKVVFQAPADAKLSVTVDGSEVAPTDVTLKTSLAKAIIAKIPTATYTAKQIKPALTVKLAGKTLKAGRDYKATYTANKLPGIARVKLTGLGKYVGTKSATFKIGLGVSKIKSLAKDKRSFTAKWSRQKKGAVGYQIRYSTKKNMKGAKTITIKKNAATSYRVKKLKPGKRYYVQVRTYKKIGKKTFTSAWSTKKSVKTS